MTGDGTVLIDAGSLDTGTSRVAVGGNGTGNLTVQNGGSVACGQGRVGYYDGSTQTGGVGTALVTGAGSIWTTSDDFMVGSVGSSYGELTISAGGQVTNTDIARIGYAANAEGTVTVSGTGSKWNGDRTIEVGFEGTGTLNILSGGAVSSGGTGTWVGRMTGSDGTLLIDAGSLDTGASRLAVGGNGTGIMTVQYGGTITSAEGRVGYYDGTTETGGNGTATVTGSGSTWTNTGDFMVGSVGSSVGNLTISDGGVVSNTTAYLARESAATGTVTVTDSGSQWNNSDSLRVGQEGSGTLTVSGGGAVTAVNEIHIGQIAGATGTVTVDGSGSSLSTTYRIIVGNAGSGVLNIKNSATVTARDTYVDDDQSGSSSGTINFTNGTLDTNTLFADVANDLTGTGTVNVSGLVADVAITFNNPSALTANFAVGVGGNVAINLDADAAIPYAMGAGYTGTGSLALSNGVVLTSGDGRLAYHSGSTGAATVAGDGTAWIVQDDLDVGRFGAGTLEIADGGLVSVDGVLTIDRDVVDAAAGAVADSYINMSANSRLAVLLNGEPLALSSMIDGDLDHLRWWNESISGWDSINNATAGVDYTLATQSVGGFDYALLTIGGGPPDYDGDGDVDIADLMKWQRDDGSASGLTAWQNDFTGSLLAGSIASVPEPVSATLLLIAALFALGGRSASR